MGYRSQIVAGVPKKDKKKALNIINGWNYISEENDYVYFMADYWKWYEGYDEVDKFNNFIDEDENRFLLAVGEDGALVSQIGEPSEHEVYQISEIRTDINWKTHRS